MKVIFLDIDGVLNGHEWSVNTQSVPISEHCFSLIRQDCVQNLSLILRDTDAKIVVSSAWRYMITRSAMTTIGFEHMLRTHGVQGIQNRIIGTTREDVLSDRSERGVQIAEWLAGHPEVERYVVIDDDDLGISKLHPFVQTDGKIGLTLEQAKLVISILNRRVGPKCVNI